MNDTNEYIVQQSGTIGQEILDGNGTVICWTTDPWLAQVIAELLTQAEKNGLLQCTR